MTGINKVKAYRVANNDTFASIAQFLQITPKAYNDKENHGISFKQKEIKALIDRWKLTPEETIELFFQ